MGGALLVVPVLREKRLERRVYTLLLTTQEGLQRYHVREERYPSQAMDGGELVGLLVRGGDLPETMANPWTGRPYATDRSVDRLRYRTDGLAETYELTVLFPDRDEVRYRLDSTEHQSLE